MKDQENLKSIGLCFSGGGYRAAAFSLGVLSYLNKLKCGEGCLLDHVEALSTVSGGTITGAYYAYSRCQDVAFSGFYSRMYAFLSDDRLLSDAMAKLQDEQLWKAHHKKRSLINAFALAYKELLVLGSFGDLDAGKGSSLRDVCFNATEFTFGLTFRFQNNGVFGNHPLKSAALNALKDGFEIADAIASSSCFPFGFEPMILPDDYITDREQREFKNLKEDKRYTEGVGIMDGGIIDNQGIGSMVNIDKRRNGNLDTFIICDVGSYRMDPWKPSDSGGGKRQGRNTINQMITRTLKLLRFRWYHWLLPVLGVVLIGLGALDLVPGTTSTYLYVLGGVLAGAGAVLFVAGLITSVLRAGLFFGVRRLYNQKIPDELIDNVAALRMLDLGTVKRMVSDRLSSALVMISEVFLNQIRRLNYRLLYERDKYKDKSVIVRVYQLIGIKETLGERFQPNPDIDLPTQELNKSAMIASRMPTTLWWDQADWNVNRLDHLVACGQYTTCYNLLDYLIKNPKDPAGELRKQLETDWDVFRKTPLWFL